MHWQTTFSNNPFSEARNLAKKIWKMKAPILDAPVNLTMWIKSKKFLKNFKNFGRKKKFVERNFLPWRNRKVISNSFSYCSYYYYSTKIFVFLKTKSCTVGKNGKSLRQKLSLYCEVTICESFGRKYAKLLT